MLLFPLVRARFLRLRKHGFSIILLFPAVRARFQNNAKERFSRMLLFPLVGARFLSLRKYRFSRIGSFPVVRARFLRLRSALEALKCQKMLFLCIESGPGALPTEYPRSTPGVDWAGCGGLVGGDYRGGENKENRSIEKE